MNMVVTPILPSAQLVFNRQQRKPLLRAAQQAEQTVACGFCDMSLCASAGIDEISATLSALGLTVHKVANA